MARIVCMWKRQRRGRVGVKSPKEEDSLELNYPSFPSLLHLLHLPFSSPNAGIHRSPRWSWWPIIELWRRIYILMEGTAKSTPPRVASFRATLIRYEIPGWVCNPRLADTARGGEVAVVRPGFPTHGGCVEGPKVLLSVSIQDRVQRATIRVCVIRASWFCLLYAL